MTEAMSYLVETEQDAEVIAYKKEGQTSQVQSRTVVFKSKISPVSRKKRCWKASDAAYNFAKVQLKMKSKLTAEANKN